MTRQHQSEVVAKIGSLVLPANPSQEIEDATSAGEGLGAFDKEAAVFDDTPPSGFSSEAIQCYQAAYRQANPAYAI